MNVDRLKGLVLSGGHGTRLRPLTFTRAKQLIPVGNKPILFYGLEDLARAGIRDVGIVVGETRDEIVQAVGDGSRFGMRVTYIDQPEPLGLAHAVRTAREYLGEAPFIMYLGDNILKRGVNRLVERFLSEEPSAFILLARVEHPERFGVAVLEDRRVIRLVEKPRRPPSDLALVGVYLFQPEIHEVIEDLQPSARGEYEITDAIQGLIDRGREVRYDIVEGWWKDTGQPADLLEANRLVLEDLEPETAGEVVDTRVQGRVRIGAGTRVSQSTLRGPLIIGRDCVIEHAYIGPFTTLQDGVVVRDAEIENSILMSGAVVESVATRIEGSLFGRGSRLRHRTRKPRTIRVMLGDQSRVDLP